MDMTAWVREGTREEVGVITDFTDSRFTPDLHFIYFTEHTDSA
jgi:hypothetical protein